MLTGLDDVDFGSGVTEWVRVRPMTRTLPVIGHREFRRLRHSPARHRWDALRHPRQPRRGARPPTFGSAGPHVGLDCLRQGESWRWPPQCCFT